MKKYTYTEKIDTRSGFGAGLHQLGKTNPNVVALVADLTGSLKMDAFKKDPDGFMTDRIDLESSDNLFEKYRDNNQNNVIDALNEAIQDMEDMVGISISEDVNVFSPACDAILDAKLFNKLPKFLTLSKKTIQVIKASFLISLLYNIIGMYFALTGQLTPFVAAILMPLSSITIVIFVTILTNWISKKQSI